MTDEPKRLRTSSSDAMLTGLLDVARDERPSSAALQRTLLAVGGVGVALSASSGSAAAATSAASSGAAASATSSGGVATGAGGVASGASGAGVSAAGVSGAGAAGAGGAVTQLGAAGAGATIGTASIGATSVAAKLTFGTTVVTVGKWVGIGAVGIGVATQAPEWASDVATPSAATQSAAIQNAATHVAIEQSAKAARNPAAVRLAPRGELPSNLPSVGAEVPNLDEPHAARSDESGRDDAAPNPSNPGGAVQTTSGASRDSKQASSDVNVPGAAIAAQRGAREVIDPGGAAEAIAAEVSLVDRARGSLQSGLPQRALSLLAGYEQTFPRQQLIVEVVVLRMEASHALGQRNRAAGLARRVLEMQGGTPHVSRAKEILQGVKQSEQRETEH